MVFWKKRYGPCAATLTPMHQDGSINLELCSRYVDHLVNTGVKAVFVNGTSGESMSLTVDERKLIAEAWVNNGRDKLDAIIVHCGAGNVEESKDLAKHAQSIGVDAISVICPSFFKASGTENIVQYLKAVADTVPDMPFLYYHFPMINGVNGSLAEILEHGKKVIPNLVGAKFTAYELNDAMAASFINDRSFEIFVGFESVLLGGLAMGIDSSIGISWSIMGKVWHRLTEAFHAGDLKKAQQIQLELNKMSRIIKQNDSLHYIPAHKAAMKLIGMDFGPARIPICTVSAASFEVVKKELEEANFEAFIQ